MIVDADLLRMGAGFADSAGVMARRGAQQFASVPVTSGIFGDFAEADEFHQAVSSAHDRHARTTHRHHEALNVLAEKATSAAAIFAEQDEHGASSLDAARRSFDA